MQRPADIAYGLDDAPPAAETAALAAQTIAIQSIYLILPGLVGSAFGLLPIDIVNFLCLSVAVVAITGLLQALPRGPIGSGYAVASIPSPVFVAVYLLAATEANLLVASALAVAAGLVGLVLSLLLTRLQAILPTEVAGVVVFLIGVSLLPRAFAAAAPADIAHESQQLHVLVTLAALVVMMAVALTRGRLARYGVLIGAGAGTVLALALGMGTTGAADLLADAPWLALPVPDPPNLDAFDIQLLPAFLVALLATLASWAGDLVAFQRASDRNWRRPDGLPIRRGFLAQSLGVVVAGLSGGMVPSSSSACVGLAIATRTLSRRVVIWASVGLLALACCPKLLSLIVLLPDAVKAAMLGYVCCFMMAAGCQLITSRMLDARRTFVVGLGLTTGLGVLIAPDLFTREMPRALQSVVTGGALVAVALNLMTSFLVHRRASLTVRAGPAMTQEIVDEVEAMGGAWGARRQSMEHVGHALLEVAEVLAERGVPMFQVAARYDEDQVALSVTWAGEPLPHPTPRPDVTDLDGPLAAQEAFALWLATRHALSVDQRVAGGQCELRMSFAG